jgi:hypothetical protein
MLMKGWLEGLKINCSTTKFCVEVILKDCQWESVASLTKKKSKRVPIDDIEKDFIDHA